MTKKKSEGLSLEDAFADDEDIEYAKQKPRKLLPKKEKESKRNDSSSSGDNKLIIKSSKPISQIKKGDKIKVDSLTLEVDAHIILLDHKTTKEMAIECFDPKTDKDYQVRYFSDQVGNSIEVYKLEEIVYNRIEVKEVEW